MTNETNENSNEEAVQTQNTQQPSADLNISDLVAIKSIIEVASQRGAFKANELEAVGKTFNKLNNFLETVSKKES
jgi:hypothetical protein